MRVVGMMLELANVIAETPFLPLGHEVDARTHRERDRSNRRLPPVLEALAVTATDCWYRLSASTDQLRSWPQFGHTKPEGQRHW